MSFGPGHGGQLVCECLYADCTMFAAEQEMSTCCLFIFSAHLNVKLHNILFSFFHLLMRLLLLQLLPPGTCASLKIAV